MNFKIIMIILMLLNMLLLNGCSSKEINQISVAICIGIDKTDDGYIVTQQILNPKAIAAKKYTNEPAVIVFSSEGKDVFEIIRRMITLSPRKIYTSHLRLVIFGEKLARDGIEDVIDFFARDHEFRTDFYFAIAKNSTARDTLHVLTRPESIPGLQLYNSLETSEKDWAPTKTVRIIELINTLISEGKNLSLTGIEITGDYNTTDTTDALKLISLNNTIKLTGLSVFKKDKLVGWLSEDESKGYNYIIGNIKSTVGHITFNEGKTTVEVTNSKSKIKAYMLNKKPAISVEINIVQNVGAVIGTIDGSDEKTEDIIIEASKKKILDLCDSVLKKTQEDLKTDIFGFGEVIHRKYPDLWKQLKEDWNNEYVELPIKVSVNVKISKLGQISKSFFKKENK